MQFWKNLKNVETNKFNEMKEINENKKILISLISTISLISIIIVISACDRLAPAARKVEQVGRQEYFGFRSDKWQEIEDSYLGAQAACCGRDTMKNDVRALELYCRAAQYGHKASMIEIGRMYIHDLNATAGNSSPIPYDKTLAYAYFAKGGEGGYEYGATMKANLEKKLSAEELERAKALIAAFPNIPCAITK